MHGWMGYIMSGLFGCRYIWNIHFGLKWILHSGVKVWTHFFYGYVHSKTTLKEFVHQFDNALRRMVENEKKADFNYFNRMIPCLTPYP